MSDLPAAHRSSDSPVAGADPDAQSDQVFELAAEVFRLMSAPMRLRIISALCQGEKNVGELLRELYPAGAVPLGAPLRVWIFSAKPPCARSSRAGPGSASSSCRRSGSPGSVMPAHR